MPQYDKDMKTLLDECQALGWQVTVTGEKAKIVGPEGSNLGPVFLPTRCGQGRSLSNYKAELRRAGCPVGTPRVPAKARAAAGEGERPAVQQSPQQQALAALEVLRLYVEKDDREDAAEWRGLAEQMESDLRDAADRLAAADKAIRERDALLTDIKAALALPSWEVLARIAALLEVTK